jgi:hypothetical protein
MAEATKGLGLRFLFIQPPRLNERKYQTPIAVIVKNQNLISFFSKRASHAKNAKQFPVNVEDRLKWLARGIAVASFIAVTQLTTREKFQLSHYVSWARKFKPDLR